MFGSINDCLQCVTARNRNTYDSQDQSRLAPRNIVTAAGAYAPPSMFLSADIPRNRLGASLGPKQTQPEYLKETLR